MIAVKTSWSRRILLSFHFKLSSVSFCCMWAMNPFNGTNSNSRASPANTGTPNVPHRRSTVRLTFVMWGEMKKEATIKDYDNIKLMLWTTEEVISISNLIKI